MLKKVIEVELSIDIDIQILKSSTNLSHYLNSIFIFIKTYIRAAMVVFPTEKNNELQIAFEHFFQLKSERLYMLETLHVTFSCWSFSHIKLLL